LVTKTAPRFWNWVGEEKQNGTQYDSYSKLDNFPLEHYKELVVTCEQYGVEFLSTPFDEESADFLISIGMKAIKVSSSDLTYLPFLSYLAKSKLPIFLSTGAATLGDIEEAVQTIEAEGNRDIVIMHCTLCYPTDFKDANLRVIPTLANVFPDYTIGISDHTLGTIVPPVAVALGARLVEKHYTVDKTLLKSADHWLSVDPIEMRTIVTDIRHVELALGESKKRVFSAEEHTYKYDKRSLVATSDIQSGSVIARNMLTGKRPGGGIPTKFISTVVGRRAACDIAEDTTITWDMV
jgi:sialic acid synthase SpsE